ncbi:alpha-(1,3)-fucosyltransferase C-like isoform X1 [Haliotis cracherodii]|uniref:alpha-(1,3)-fucosyltransferase C-like isoform X1 n=1 Tax=Haliotis cracherodii TaxID=6455 RepID=UPI0039E82296
MMPTRLFAKCKFTLKHIFMYMIVFCVTFIIYCITNTTVLNVRKPLLKFHPREFSNSSHKTILLWTSFFGSSSWNVNFKLPKCKRYSPKTCELTSDRSRLETSEAVLFHLGNIVTIPSERRTQQIWVLFNMEPLPKIRRDLKQYNGVFNWTSWYRRQSTVPMYYGWVETKLDKSGAVLKDIFAEKTKMAFWAASNCEDDAHRYRTVKELQGYIDVDTYGECGDIQCSRWDKTCNEKLKKYKFVLSFENCHCKDYVTEKYWLALQREQIPIVHGGADYKALVPPRSFINVRDFPSISALATYIITVAQNRTLYNSYFDWMRYYHLPPCLETMNCFDLENYFCSLCGALHDRGIPGQTYTNLYKWATDDLPQCKEYTILVEQFIEDPLQDRSLSED